MLSCIDYRNLLLDHLYGLLDKPEAAALRPSRRLLRLPNGPGGRGGPATIAGAGGPGLHRSAAVPRAHRREAGAARHGPGDSAVAGPDAPPAAPLAGCGGRSRCRVVGGLGMARVRPRLAPPGNRSGQAAHGSRSGSGTLRATLQDLRKSTTSLAGPSGKAVRADARAGSGQYPARRRQCLSGGDRRPSRSAPTGPADCPPDSAHGRESARYLGIR